MRTPTGDDVSVRRGEVWWVNLDPTQGGEIRKTRPAVVLTANGLNRVRRTVVIVPLSTGPQPRPPIVVATPPRERMRLPFAIRSGRWTSGV